MDGHPYRTPGKIQDIRDARKTQRYKCAACSHGKAQLIYTQGPDGIAVDASHLCRKCGALSAVSSIELEKLQEHLVWWRSFYGLSLMVLWGTAAACPGKWFPFHDRKGNELHMRFNGHRFEVIPLCDEQDLPLPAIQRTFEICDDGDIRKGWSWK